MSRKLADISASEAREMLREHAERRPASVSCGCDRCIVLRGLLRDRGKKDLRLTRHAAGDYRTLDGRWQIVQPRGMDNGLQRRWIIREYVWDADPPRWFALDDDYATLSEAREGLAEEAQ